MTEAMIRHFLKKFCPSISFTLPSDDRGAWVPPMSKEAVLEAALKAGAKSAIEEPMAAAIGDGLAIEEPRAT